jgi:hypothetical protein
MPSFVEGQSALDPNDVLPPVTEVIFVNEIGRPLAQTISKDCPAIITR